MRPPFFKALLKVRAWAGAESSAGSNQSIESIIWCKVSMESPLSAILILTTAIVRVPGVIRLITSLISSVWMRRPSNAPGVESLTCA